MDSFPSEFADLLNKRGQRLIANPPRLAVFRTKRATPIVVFDDVIDDRVARRWSSCSTGPCIRSSAGWRRRSLVNGSHR
jgi:hypothetical protein